MNETKNYGNVGNPESDYLDFSQVDEMYIPSYKELINESDNPTGKIAKNTLNQFKMYEGFIDIEQINKNDIVNGTVIRITDKDVLVDIGNKDNVIINRKGSEEKICKQLSVGKTIDVLITDINENPFIIKGSVSDLIKMDVDKKMISFFENDKPFECYVKETIPAGYMLDIEIDGIKIDGFMPNTLADVNKLHDYNILNGQTIMVMLETLQQDKGIYVVSRKKYLKSLIPEKIKSLKKQPRDKVYTGIVTGTRDFGIFVQFEDCLTGMIHKANIRKDYQDKINEIQPGTLIDFYVKDVIKNGQQIILSQKLEETIWDTIRVGDTFNGEVISIKPFGTLVKLDFETNGLIQITYINRNDKRLEVGQKIDVVVISIIRDDRKIYLTFADDSETLNKLKEKSDELEKLKQRFNNN